MLGVYFSSKAGTPLDTAVTFFALFMHAFPGILLLILLQLFAGITGLFPVTAYPPFPFSENPARFTFSYAYHVFLPLLTAFLGGAGGTLRMIRATMLDQMGMPYIFALRARGISEKRVYLNQARTCLPRFSAALSYWKSFSPIRASGGSCTKRSYKKTSTSSLQTVCLFPPLCLPEWSSPTFSLPSSTRAYATGRNKNCLSRLSTSFAVNNKKLSFLKFV